MTAGKGWAFSINLVGGLAVLASYAYWLATHPELRGEVWGGVPNSFRGFYTVSMLSAAVGYFLFGFFVLFRVEAATARVGGWAGFELFNVLYALILIPSALWMPLTFEMVEAPGAGLWYAIRLVLGIVGLASLVMLWAILKVDAPGSRISRGVGALGCMLFSIQTALLDALIWPYYFPF